MNLEERIEIMVKLGKYLLDDGPQLKIAKHKAFEKNKWFTQQFTDLAIKNIAEKFLDKDKLRDWVQVYHLDDNVSAKRVGIVMAGNIPLVGFHDFLSVFISGHRQKIKLSDKDDVLLPYIFNKLLQWNPEIALLVEFADVLKDCDAYIATGSNNSARYFNYYFGKYPSIIRRNKTSAAILTGDENIEQLQQLADDVHTYFGLGCRNITSLFVPHNYDFASLIDAFRKYSYLSNHAKYKNNYDYNLAMLIMNNQKYMTSESVILYKSESVFSPVSQVNYQEYKDKDDALERLQTNEDIQCIEGYGGTDFGNAQTPGLMDYADNADTMQFLLGL